MTHPVDKLSAAVDGELGHDARDKVFGHLVSCDTCRATVEAGRELKARLAGLHEPEPSLDLAQRLLGISSYATEPREQTRPVVSMSPTHSASGGLGVVPQKSISVAGRVPASTRPASRTPRSRRRTVVFSAAGSAAAVATLLGTAFVIGEPPREQPPLLQPPVNSFSVDHASTADSYPFGDPAALLYSTAPTGTADPRPPLLQPVGNLGR